MCKKETVFSFPGEPPHYNLKVCANAEDIIRFSYAAQKGLNQSGKAGGIISENILGQLLSIPTGDLDATIQFLEKYGFLFPISSEEYESVDCIILLEIINRIKATVQLMGTIAGKRDYEKMLLYTTYLLYSHPIKLQLTNYVFNSYKNYFLDMIENFNTMPDINESQEIFDSGYLSVDDTIIKGYNRIYREDLISMLMGNGLNNIPGSSDKYFKHLFALYTNYHTDDENLRTIIDFYYHYQIEVGFFKDLSVNQISYYTAPKRENFSEAMKVSLLKIAKIVISEEINANLKDISPQLQVNTLSPSWRLNSLLEALYLSIFYMKPGVELYKECENPNCKYQKYFLIKATVTNKRYCCTACGSAAAQRRSRQRKLEKK